MPGDVQHPLFVSRVKDARNRDLVKFAWNGNEIIMTKKIAEGIAEFILAGRDGEETRPVLAFNSPGATAAAVTKAYVAPATMGAIDNLERSDS